MCYNKIGAGRKELILLPTTAEYLQDLVEQKNALADKIADGGISADRGERLNTLVPKIDELYDEAQRAFADHVQNHGKRQYYSSMFFGFDNLEFLRKFRYDLYCFGATSMFNSTGGDTELYPDGFDLVEILKDAGISLTWRSDGIAEASSMFYKSRVSHIPPIKISGLNTLTYVFYGCSCLKTIDSLNNGILSSTTGWFTGCTALENITFEGKWQATVDLSDCPLTLESIMSLLNILVDKTSVTSYTYKITLGTDNLAKLTDEQKALATEKNWTLA